MGTPLPSNAGFEGDLAAAGGGNAPGGALHGSEEEEWEGGGRKGACTGPGNALVAPVHVARQRCHVIAPSAQPWCSTASSASVAALSRHMHWRDRGYLSRQVHWRDQTGYVVQIILDTS